MKGFLDYIPGDSVIHRLDPRTKLLLALLICVGCFGCDSVLALPAFIALDLLIGALGGITRVALRLLYGLAKLSAFLFILQVLFIRRGQPLFYLLPGFAVTDDGVLTACLVVLRLVGATLPLALMISMTQLSALACALVTKCRVPYKYAFAITSAIRFIPAFSRDMSDIMEAQTARGVEFDTRNPIKKLGLVAPLCVPLLISSVGKIEHAAIAAELRGFNLRTASSYSKSVRMTGADALALLMGAAAAAAGIML